MLLYLAKKEEMKNYLSVEYSIVTKNKIFAKFSVF